MWEWKKSSELVDYPEAIAWMEERVEAIRTDQKPPCIWLLEHPPLYTEGTSAKSADLLSSQFPVYKAGRGGEYTYHGPGQRVAYVMVDLKALFAPNPPDLRAYIQRLENWSIAALAEFGVKGFTREGRIGVWVDQSLESGVRSSEIFPSPTSKLQTLNSETKIAAIGVRVRKWVAYHGICINVHPDLSHYNGIVPCGIKEYGVTSLQALEIKASLEELDAALKRTVLQLTHQTP